MLPALAITACVLLSQTAPVVPSCYSPDETIHQVGFIPETGALDLVVDGDLLFVDTGRSYRPADHEVAVFDISDPLHPVRINETLVDLECRGLAASDGMAFFVINTNPFGCFGQVVVMDFRETTPRSYYRSPHPEASSGWADGLLAQEGLLYSASAIYSDNDEKCEQLQLSIFDISTPTPTGLGSVDLPAFRTDLNPTSIAVRDGIAFLAATHGGLLIVDVADPLNPQFLGHYDLDPAVREVALYETHALLLRADTGSVEVFDVSDPSDPLLAVVLPFEARRIAVEGNRLFLTGDEQIDVYDLTNALSPTHLGIIDINTGWSGGRIGFNGDIAYVGIGERSTDGPAVVEIYDLSSDSFAGVLSTFSVSAQAVDLSATGNFVLSAQASGGLEVISLETPLLPTLEDALHDADYLAVACSGTRAVALTSQELRVLELSESGQLSFVSALPIPPTEYVWEIDLSGNVCTIRNGPTLSIIDLEDPELPVVRSTISRANMRSVGFENELLFVVANSVEVISISDLENPQVLSTIEDDGAFENCDMQGEIVAVTWYPDALTSIYSLADPENPFVLSQVHNVKLHSTPVLQGTSLAVYGATWQQQPGQGSVSLFDMTDPSAPVRVSTVHTQSPHSAGTMVNGHPVVALDSEPTLQILSRECGVVSTVELGNGAAASLSPFQIRPSPSRGHELSLSWATPRAAESVAEVIDASGRQVLQLPVRAGATSLRWQASGHDELASGSYWVRWKGGSQEAVRFVVLR